MSLIEDLSRSELLDSKFNKRCGVCRLLEKLPADEVEALTAALNNPDIAKSKVAKVLQANGHKISSGVLTRHCRGECVG